MNTKFDDSSVPIDNDKNGANRILINKKAATIILVLLLIGALAAFIALGFESPNEHYAHDDAAVSSIGTITLKVSCKELVGNDDVPERLVLSGVIPDDGILIDEVKLPLTEGSTAFSVLRDALNERHIHLDYSSITDKSVYVRGINNIYEYDLGDLSGWMYSVNGIFPTVSSSEYVLSDGDAIVWQYTCDLGRDVGDTYYTMNGDGSDG